MADFKCCYFVHAIFQCTPIFSLYIMSLHKKKIIFKDVGKFLWLNISGYILRKKIECDR